MRIEKKYCFAAPLHLSPALQYALRRFDFLFLDFIDQKCIQFYLLKGLQGQLYAIPTMEGMQSTRLALKRFIQFALQHSELKFMVTPIGYGIAGNTPEEIAPMFTEAVALDNVFHPMSFWEVLMPQYVILGSRPNTTYTILSLDQ